MKEQNYHAHPDRANSGAFLFVTIKGRAPMKNPNSERGGLGILGALLIAGAAILCLMIVAGIIVARSVHVVTTARSGGDDVSIDLPGGHLNIRAHDKGGTVVNDIPMYPGAHNNEHRGGGAVIQWNSNSGNSDNGFSVSASESITSDPFEKVVDYYRAQLPNWMITKQHNGSVNFELHDGGYKRVVGIHEESDGTHIGVASVGEPASN
jgi:hypothetical protein